MTRHYFPEGLAFGVSDICVLVAYFVLIIAIGAFVSWKNRNDSVRNYFLAGRDVNWILVGTGLFATNISSTHFIGLTGSASKSGIAIAGFELNAMFILIFLGWIFVPVYLASGVYTLPEYLLRRFGSFRIQIYLSGLSLLLSLLIRISAELYAGAIFIQQTLQWNLYYSSAVLLLIAGLYTVVGGLTAVMWTDFIQTTFIISGATAISVLSFQAVGGYSELVKNFPLATDVNVSLFSNPSCAKVPDDFMQLLRSVGDPEYPWTGMVFGLSISAIWNWCSDQVLVQRCLSAKNLSHAKGGCIMAAYLKALPLFLFVFPGMAARILFPGDVACSSPEACRDICGSPYGCGDIAYPLLVLKLMPAGARGFMMSVILASIMGSLTAVLNSSATLFTMDIWPRFRRKASEVELLVVGRVFITVMSVLSVLWVPVIKASQGSQLFNYTQSITSYLSPPVCAVYLLAIFYSRINEKGAFWGLMLGLVIGMTRFVLDMVYTPGFCGQHVQSIPAIVSDVHYLHFGCILFVIVGIVTIVISLCTAPIDEKHLYRLTFWTRHSRKERVDLDCRPPEPALVRSATCSFIISGRYLPSSSDYGHRWVYGGRKNSFSPSQVASSVESTSGNQGTCGGPLLAKLCCMRMEQLTVGGDEQVRRPTPAQNVLEADDLLRERKHWKWILNINAIVMLCVAVAFWVVYK